MDAYDALVYEARTEGTSTSLLISQRVLFARARELSPSHLTRTCQRQVLHPSGEGKPRTRTAVIGRKLPVITGVCCTLHNNGRGLECGLGANRRRHAGKADCTWAIPEEFRRQLLAGFPHDVVPPLLSSTSIGLAG